tara:strand:+ start:571 stop:813 length:243 start_codon:yes stop_codon:yes gene_type:complete
MADIQHATRKGDNMRHDETRDNITDTENTIIEADAREELRTAAARQTLDLDGYRQDWERRRALWTQPREHYEHHTDYFCP